MDIITMKTLITITPLQWHVQDNATETIILQVVPTDKSMLTICVVKYDMLLHDVMEFLCLMSDGLVKTRTTKCIKHIFTKVFLHKNNMKDQTGIPLLDKPEVLRISSLDST